MEQLSAYLASLQNRVYRQSHKYQLGRPHSCSYCSSEIIGPDFEVDLGHAASETTFHLSRDLAGAVEASKAGCALYEWLLRLLAAWYEKSNRLAVQADDIVDAEFSILLSRQVGVAAHPVIRLRTFDAEETVLDTRHIETWLAVGAIGDTAADYIEAWPTEHDVASTRSIEFAKTCLMTCKRDHLSCRRSTRTLVPTPAESSLERRALTDEHRIAEGLATLVLEAVDQDELPLRLLQIGTLRTGDTRLVETQLLDRSQRAEICSAGFVTLSYCWGGDQAEKLTSNNLSSYKNGVDVNDFSKTIQDAVWFTTQLGLRYIWIDALCILQDDDDDKGREIAKMALYYGTSTVTLCAASASSSHRGFLERRPEQDYGVGPFEIPFRSGGEVGSVLLYDDPELETPTEPLSSRAWTLQESMLSRRMIIFSSSQLFWTCCNSNASCGGRYSKLTAREMGFPHSLVPGIFPIESMWSYPVDVAWRLIVSDFCARQMTVAEDKLLAISALASFLHQRFVERHGETKYIAGLFFQSKKPDYIVRSLLWFTDWTVARRAAVYRAPAWSWACVDGPIHALDEYGLYPLSNERTRELPTVELKVTDHGPTGAQPQMHMFSVKTEIVGDDIELANPAAAYGAVRKAELMVRGPLKIVDVDNADLRAITTFVHNKDDLKQLEAQVPWWALIPDTPSDKAMLDDPTSAIYCLELIASNNHSLSFGLLLDRFSSARPQHFRRVGVYVFSCRSYAFPETELVSKTREAFFQRGHVTDLVLV